MNPPGIKSLDLLKREDPDVIATLGGNHHLSMKHDRTYFSFQSGQPSFGINTLRIIVDSGHEIA